ncbi:alpha/beta hydrolase [Vibrio gangliei]|uniref:alpha/beta hydrolase n=1 Tax=Vibrio gangliei TaxID=2077090 RepID=UPI000D53011F|nr:alpha/beta hydrolase [Vibrio gangliei]
MSEVTKTRNTGNDENTMNTGRRDMMKVAGAGLVALGIGSLTSSQAMAKEELELTSEWDKTFAKRDEVTHKKVSFPNRYGITLVADLYQPKSASGKLPAIVLSGPFGAVKEQSSGLYAQTMAERGFVTLAFDPSYTGESGGEPRNIASPDINTEDFSAAVGFLGLQSNVDSEKIVATGRCDCFIAVVNRIHCVGGEKVLPNSSSAIVSYVLAGNSTR